MLKMQLSKQSSSKVVFNSLGNVLNIISEDTMYEIYCTSRKYNLTNGKCLNVRNNLANFFLILKKCICLISIRVQTLLMTMFKVVLGKTILAKTQELQLPCMRWMTNA